jgi:hypothetical protein
MTKRGSEKMAACLNREVDHDGDEREERARARVCIFRSRLVAHGGRLRLFCSFSLWNRAHNVSAQTQNQIETNIHKNDTSNFEKKKL